MSQYVPEYPNMGSHLSAASTDPDAVIHGIPRIAEFIGATERRAQWLHESRQIPTFKLGKLICLRVGTWREHVERLEQETRVS